jgi:exosortase/archaeosortase family protein
MTQYFLGALALVLCTVLSLVITHPSPLLSGRMFGIMEAYPEIGGPFMGAVVYLIMVLPLVPALACFIPPIVLRPRLGLLGFGAALFMAFLFSEVVNAYYYYLTGPFIVSSVKAVLSLISHAPDAPVGRWGISFGDFRVMLGYSCTELSSFLLFFGLVGFSWWRYRPQGFLRNAGLFVLVVMGLVFLWFLNIARIVAVMMVGSLNPELAIGIFHSAAGPILFFGFFLVYIRFVLRLVHAGSAVRKKATA